MITPLDRYSQLFEQKKPELPPFWSYFIAFLITIAIMVLITVNMARAEVIPSNEVIAEAIYKAENSVKYPYGVKSINTHSNKEYARKICLNTIRNHKKRHAEHKCGLDFITCLGNRYSPPAAHSLNRNWARNVKTILNNQKYAKLTKGKQ